ncbi:MAG: hypothetical protein WDW36_007572 [Sanguina aurantia]
MSGSMRGLARTVMSASRGLPMRAGAGAPIKLAIRPDKPLPFWYELWWDNGVYPGQPCVDYMFGPLPANLTETWYVKFWAGFAAFWAIPIYYAYNVSDEFRMPMVPHQYPPEVRAVLLRSSTTDQRYDISAPDYADLKLSRRAVWTAL